jgi:hypothetical protein
MTAMATAKLLHLALVTPEPCEAHIKITPQIERHFSEAMGACDALADHIKKEVWSNRNPIH